MNNIQYRNNEIKLRLYQFISATFIYHHLRDGYKCPIYKFVNCAGMAAFWTPPKSL